MNRARTILGVLIMIFFAIPTMFAIIWAVGITQAAISPELLSDLPQEIIQKVPEIIDETLTAIEKDDELYSGEAEVWMKAMSQTDQRPKQVLESSGMMDWLQHELTDKLKRIGKILRGEERAQRIMLNLQPLKESLLHPSLWDYFRAIVAKLPVCDEYRVEKWQQAVGKSDPLDNLPACRPDTDTLEALIVQAKYEIREDIPDEVDIFEHEWLFPGEIPVARSIVSFTYILFLIPAAFILVGALVGAVSKSAFFKWSGITTLISGIIPLAITSIIRELSLKLVHWGPFYDHELNLSGVEEIFWNKFSSLFEVLADHLFSPVGKVAGVVCVVGILLFALSFLIGEEESAQRTQNKQTETDSGSESKDV